MKTMDTLLNETLKGNTKSISRVRRAFDYDGTYFLDKDLYENRELMMSFFKRNLDNHNAQNLYSENIINSNQNSQDEAIRLLKLSIDSGNVDAIWNLGTIQYRKDNKKDALKLWKLATEKGSAYGQYKMACIYENGGEVEKNLFEAFRLCKLSAEQDNADAQYKLGCMYYYGKGTDSRNHSEAAKWFKLAADQNHYVALNSLAYLHSYGYGVEKSQLEAIKYYNIAYKQHRHYHELQPLREKSMPHGYLEQELKDYTLELSEIVPKLGSKIDTLESQLSTLTQDNKILQDKLETIESKNIDNTLRINHLQRKLDRLSNKLKESLFDKLKLYFASFDCFR
ncbi:MAG: hypothetical protein Hyperionvirus20_33 [Hyperionvirus sp.]|uniref:Sel1 repeat family protein n=1 Tax=Hyperionvirus sp. TaxID=2487770 RepID=A0A3G5AAI7_9VIRU|nr:MAG: hypothetical protein Hyperionvirus20_33 [Hyperionvirus sp.]